MMKNTKVQNQLLHTQPVQAPVALLPQKSLQQFVADSQQKGFSAEAMWQNVIKAVHDYAALDSVGCFVAGTYVEAEHEDEIVMIDKLKVGDRVLSRPENGENTVSYQSIQKTHTYFDKPIWILQLEKIVVLKDKDGNKISYDDYDNSFENIKLLATPNHPVWVVGYRENPEADIAFYDKSLWKRIDELQRWEVAVNHQGVMYQVERAQPVYQYADIDESEASPDLYWYQEYYYEDYYDDYLQGDSEEGLLSEEEFNSIGYVYDANYYETNGGIGSFVKHDTANTLKNDNGEYLPFTRTVYNFEVENNHTYYVGLSGLWVHNTSSPAQKHCIRSVNK